METIHKAHESHPEIINRLRRAEGHLRSVIQMIEAAKPCLAVAQQLHAVEAAITNAKKVFIEDHLDHCLDDVFEINNSERQSKIDEFKKIAKYL